VTQWRNLKTLEELNAPTGTLVAHLGIRFIEIGPDFVRGSIPVDSRTTQPYGLLHGGASVALAETLGSTAANMSVDARYQVLGQEINANHVRAVRGGWVTGTARPAHIGARTHVWTIEIVNEDGKLVCISRLTVAVIKRGELLGS
jgi:1,4-dihydroxy-2-naphthoyl-CoA hydrolase